MTGDPRFHAELKRIADLHDAKQQDYGREEDPFANVRSSEEWGMSPWVGAMVRANDKMKRLQKAARGGTMTNEAVEDSFQDLAVYALIGLILYRESQQTEESPVGQQLTATVTVRDPKPVEHQLDDDQQSCSCGWTEGAADWSPYV